MWLEEKLWEYKDNGRYPFHMPGHKRNKFLEEENMSRLLDELHSIDITEISGFDNLNRPEGILLELEKEMASFYHTKRTYPCVNGSTAGVLSAIAACTKPGDSILIARNCHKSVINACALRGLNPVYLSPEWIEECGIYGGITGEAVDKALQADSDIKAVVLVSPTYEGIVSDIKAIKELTAKEGIPLIVDEAHGAHFNYACETADFPVSAVRYADIVIQSLHKTLPCMTQTALVHVSGDLVNLELLEYYLQTFQTSSPSYVLMADVSHCFHYMKGHPHVMSDYEDRLKAFRRQADKLSCVRLIGKKDIGKYGIFDYDIGKLTFIVRNSKLTGKKLFEMLRDRYNIELEMSSISYCIAMTAPFDTDEGFSMLMEALSEIDRGLASAQEKDRHYPECSVARKAVTPTEALYMEDEIVPLEAACGRISKKSIYIYPPGSAFLVSGEIIEEKNISQIKAYSEAGFEIVGMPKVGFITVVK